jgi:hypothetical protein
VAGAVLLLIALGWLLALLTIITEEWGRASGWAGPAFGALIA